MAHAITFSKFGGPEVLEWVETDKEEPGKGQIRVRTKVAAINAVDAKIRRGDMEAVFPTRFPATVGSDVAGIVDAVGEGVSDVAVGDEVLGFAVNGAYSEFAIVADYVAKPANMPWTVAGSLPVIGEAAVRVLGQLPIHTGETLLVLGGAGGVGSVVTQLAVRQGIKVISAVADRDRPFVQSLGATPVLYGEGLQERVRQVTRAPIAAALDTAGHGALVAALELTGSPDRVITTADEGAGKWGVKFSTPARAAEAVSKAEGQDVEFSIAESAEHINPLQTIVDAYVSEPLIVRIGTRHPLAAAAYAHRDLEDGVSGKVILTADSLDD